MKLIADEASLNIEIGAYRSAIVMAWILTYDYLRYWLLKGKTGNRKKVLHGILWVIFYSFGSWHVRILSLR